MRRAAEVRLDELEARRRRGDGVRAASRHQNLSPDREVPNDIKQILGGLASVGGIGALRTHAGDAHGRGLGTPRVDTRVARLAVHVASTLALFLIETWQKRTVDAGET